LNEIEIIYIFNYIIKLPCLKDVVVQKIEPMGMKRIYIKINMLCYLSLIWVQNFELFGV
jgi:hypothetical protein